MASTQCEDNEIPDSTLCELARYLHHDSVYQMAVELMALPEAMVHNLSKQYGPEAANLQILLLWKHRQDPQPADLTRVLDLAWRRDIRISKEAFRSIGMEHPEKGNSQCTTVSASEAADKELPVDKTRTPTQQTKQTVLISCNKIVSILPGAVRERMTKHHCLVLISCLIIFASVITMKAMVPNQQVQHSGATTADEVSRETVTEHPVGDSSVSTPEPTHPRDSSLYPGVTRIDHPDDGRRVLEINGNLDGLSKVMKGQVDFRGRLLKYELRLRVKGLSWSWKVTLTDPRTGFSIEGDKEDRRGDAMRSALFRLAGAS